jgi:two-component system phosphate regulon response regulator PhoB
VVDDEKDIVDLVTLHLQREGHEVLSIGNGLGVLPLAVQHEPDLIVLDLMLPGLDGVQVHRRLRGDSRTRHIPVIMITARSQANDRIAGPESRTPLSPSRRRRHPRKANSFQTWCAEFATAPTLKLN